MPTPSPARPFRFRPASAADFLQCAHNLAWLLGRPETYAQELLASVYGYADLSDLEAELEQPGEPGPYDEPTSWPPFLDEPTENERSTARGSSQSVEPEPLGWTRESPGDERLRRALQADATQEEFSRRELGCMQAGFFCAPQVHRRLFEHVKAGCLAAEGTQQEHRKWLELNWPIGFWPLLRLLYAHPAVLPEESDPDSGPPTPDSSNWGYGTDAQSMRLCANRAPAIYLRMISDVDVEGLDGYLESQPASLSSLRPGLYDTDFETLEEELRELLASHAVELPEESLDEEWEQSLEFLRSGGTSLELLHPAVRDVPGYAQALRSYRLRYLKDCCEAFVESGTPMGMLRSRSPWPARNPDSGHAAALQTLEELARQRRDEMRVMLDTCVVLHQAEKGETQDCHMSLWHYHSRFAQVHEDGRSAKVGEMYGWYIVPYDEEYNVHPEDFFECLDAASAQLNDVWKVLQGEYFPRQGFDSIWDYVNEKRFAPEDTSCLATVEIELEPGFRGQGLVPALLNAFYDCAASNGDGYWDQGWAAHAEEAAFRLDKSLKEAQVDALRGQCPGLPELAAPGVLVLPVEGEPPSRRVMQMHLRGSLGKIRKANPLTPAEQQKHKLMQHFLSMQELVEPDIVCYDPHEYPST